MDFEDIGPGSRLLYRRRYSIRVVEDRLLERSPSGEYIRFEVLGWVNRADLKHHELLEVLAPDYGEMCPNCLMPGKFSGPHARPCRNAPGGSPQLERYLDALELSRFDPSAVSNESDI